MTHPIPDAALDTAPTAASFWADDPATLAAFWDGFFAGRGAAHLALAQLRNVATVVTRALEVAEGQVEPAGIPGHKEGIMSEGDVPCGSDLFPRLTSKERAPLASDVKELTRQVVAFGIIEQYNRGVLAARDVLRYAPNITIAIHRMRALLRDPRKALAQGIEARSGETHGGSTEGESPAAESGAP